MRKKLASLAAGAALALAGLVLAGGPAHATGSITFVASSTSDSGTSGGKAPASITLPTWTVGTHDVIEIALVLNKDDAITVPSGYTQWVSLTGVASGAYLADFYKVAASGDSGSSVSFTLGTGARWSVVARVYSNAVPASFNGPVGYSADTSVNPGTISWNDGTTRMISEYVGAEPSANGVVSSISPMSTGYGDTTSDSTNCGSSCRNMSLFSADKAGVSTSPESPSSLTDSQSAYHTVLLTSFTPYS